MPDTSMMRRECPRCGEHGHYGGRRGCSKTHLAAELVLSGLATITQAAKRHRVAKQSVSARLIKLGHRTYKPKGAQCRPS